MTDTLRWYHYPEALKQVQANTGRHQLQVLADDGLYKHLRLAEPGTMLWSFDVITWPGHLATAGDVGSGYIFARVPNMLAFFDHGQPEGHINTGYWAEKLIGHRDVLVWSPERFRAYATDAVRDLVQSGGLSTGEVQALNDDLAEVLDDCDNESETLARWAEVSAGGYAIEQDWDSRAWTDYEHQLLLAVHLILKVARAYHASHGRTGTGER